MTFGPLEADMKHNDYILGSISPQTAHDYEDIWLTPKYSSVSSRKECDTSVDLGGHKFNLPIIPANMATVIGQEFAIWLAERGYFYIMHRFDLDQIQFCKDMSFRGLIKSISLGVKAADRQLVKDLEMHNIYPEFITIDIAHGNSVVMRDMLQWLKKTEVGKKAFVIAGNVCEPEGVRNLEEWGADAIKVGVGPGCFTAGTEVLTENGYIPVENVSKGDKVLTHKNRFMPVLNTISRDEEDKIYKINETSCTGNHEFYVIHKKFKNIINENNIDKYAEWISAENLTKDYLLVQYK
jgi:hypothetical protein